MIITAGTLNVSVYFFIVQDAGGTNPGEPKTAMLFSDIETGGSASYMRQGAARVDLTLITLASASAAHADGGFILVDDTNMPGLYRCDVPDAAFASGVDQVVIQLVAASAQNALIAPLLVDIGGADVRAITGNVAAANNLKSACDNYSATRGLTGTAVPNAAADGEFGLPISDAGNLDLDSIKTVVDKIPLSDGANSWNTTALAAIQTKVNAAIDTAISELGVAAPSDTPSLRTGLMLLYMGELNDRKVQTSGTDALETRNAAGTIIAKKLITDDGSDTLLAKMTSG